MTPEQIALVQESFQKVAIITEQAAKIFYRDLFELDPRLQGLFHGDMTEQIGPFHTTEITSVMTPDRPLVGGSANYPLVHNSPYREPQQNWRWRNKCQSPFYAEVSMGVCPAGGAHVKTGSSNYSVAGIE